MASIFAICSAIFVHLVWKTAIFVKQHEAERILCKTMPIYASYVFYLSILNLLYKVNLNAKRCDLVRALGRFIMEILLVILMAELAMKYVWVPLETINFLIGNYFIDQVLELKPSETMGMIKRSLFLVTTMLTAWPILLASKITDRWYDLKALVLKPYQWWCFLRELLSDKDIPKMISVRKLLAEQSRSGRAAKIEPTVEDDV